MGRVIDNVTRLKKLLTGGETIPNNTGWKESPLTQILRSSFDGTAFTVFIFCLSSSNENGGESWCSMEFADRVQKLKSNVQKPMPLLYKLLVEL